MISKESLEEFKKIYKKEFGEEISDQEAFERATNLLNLYRILYKPDREIKEWDTPFCTVSFCKMLNSPYFMKKNKKTRHEK